MRDFLFSQSITAYNILTSLEHYINKFIYDSR